jgi:hypothetical protein
MQADKNVGFEVSTAVVMYAAIFRDIALCSSYVNRSFGRKYHLQLGWKSAEQETRIQHSAYPPAVRWFLVRLIFDPVDGGNTSI